MINTDYKSGDIIFYQPGEGFNFFTWAQKIVHKLGTISMPGFCHVAMVVDEKLLIEMTWPRPRFRLLAEDTRDKIVMRPDVPDAIKAQAVRWAELHVTAPYSFSNMLLGLLGLIGATHCCSAFVNEAYKSAGANVANTNDTLVSPDELASSPLLKVIP